MPQVMISTNPRKKIHPHKFAMWLALGTIAMMFAGFTSAYIVHKAQVPWRHFDLPPVFFVSTITILLSSITMHWGLRAFKKQEMPRYKIMITVTLLLGILFGIFQSLGFYELYHQPNPVRVAGNPSESFLFVIFGTHLIHILGGVLALLVVFLMALRSPIKTHKTTGLEIVATYWHFVDLLWIYLFIFFLANH
jgi:cytochrome c oxidase subunit 3